jgi:hypothetical protein
MHIKVISAKTCRPCQFCPLDVLVVLDLQPVIVAKLASEGVTSTCGCSFSDLERASAFRFWSPQRGLPLGDPFQEGCVCLFFWCCITRAFTTFHFLCARFFPFQEGFPCQMGLVVSISALSAMIFPGAEALCGVYSVLNRKLRVVGVKAPEFWLLTGKNIRTLWYW